MPHEHGHTLVIYHKAGPKEVELAVVPQKQHGNHGHTCLGLIRTSFY